MPDCPDPQDRQTPADTTNPKDKLGAKKPQTWLNPRAALMHMAKAFEFGAYGTDAEGVQVRKNADGSPFGYGPFNWRDKKVKATVYIAAMDRHIAEYLDGDDKASDSKCLHLAHIMACAAILIDAVENGNLIDDRPMRGPAAKVIAALTLK